MLLFVQYSGIVCTITFRECSGSVVKCLTPEAEGPRVRASPSSLHCGLRARHIYPSLMLVQPKKTCPYITERLLMGRKESNQTNKQNNHLPFVDFFYFVFVFAILSCLCHAALWSPTGKGLTSGSPACDVFLCICHFPSGILGQVWYLIVLIPDLCLLPYLGEKQEKKKQLHTYLEACQML